ncbi:TlpA family protein disulfide reductase [Pedobacter frigiditerrae]|uniref:TlpA family protein disulfide reductase n=1 Tax=Pedobacter frigiditerrae TaxID=2530452 RepID=A0A4R0MQN6_9SPHI|nr:TlpA disulfide reductase family protein [Pedobacter frigiditerrae]TCC89209.1 TlpA family protein disulfide reductase [Pedobacter frigiditerrae]
MKRLAIFIPLLFLSFAILAQNVQDEINYFNSFQRTKDKQPDSAVYFMQKLAASNQQSAEDLLHNSFAQSFLGAVQEKMKTDTSFLAHIKKMNMTIDSVFALMKEEKKNAHIILSRFGNDTNPFLKNNSYVVAKWVEAQDNQKDPTKLLAIGKEYLTYLSAQTDFYAERKARYGLLIAQLMVADAALKSTGDKLFKLIYSNLQKNQKELDPNELTRSTKEIRAWYRYMFAYTNFIAAQNTQDKVEKMAFLKLANEYSPDMIDKTASHAYFYDMIFLLGEEKYSFADDYLATLANDEEKFKTIMALSMNDPSFKAKAKALYKDQARFNELWLNQFNTTFKTAPAFALLQLDGTPYKLGNQKNQWTLIDFWGTWCGPCRAEHPDLQKVYLKTQNGQLPKLNVITIASRDNEPAVKAYMNQFKYSFPVVMSDNVIETNYNVSSWPSKFLISPQGKFVIIPFGVNWEKYIADYISE